jgi:hypothetical protein
MRDGKDFKVERRNYGISNGNETTMLVSQTWLVYTASAAFS